MNRILFLIFCFSPFGIACSSFDETQGVVSINLKSAYESRKPLKLSRIAKSIEYIRLESKEGSLINAWGLTPYINDSLLLTQSFRQLYLFDRSTGNFVREIGHFGKGPKAYSSVHDMLPFEKTGTAIAKSGYQNGYLEYDTDGNLLREIKKPKGATSLNVQSDSVLIFYFANFLGDEKRKLRRVNLKTKELRHYPNYRHSDGVDMTCVKVNLKSSHFYNYGESTNFFEAYGDTIFRISPSRMIPRYVFKAEEMSPVYEKQNDCDYPDKDFMHPTNLSETDDYLFFTLNFDNRKFQGLYSKKLRRTLVGDDDRYLNDLDDFIPFKYERMTSSGQLIGYLDAYMVRDWFDNNPEKAKQLPRHLKAFVDMKEEDNPIIMVVTLKETGD